MKMHEECMREAAFFLECKSLKVHPQITGPIMKSQLKKTMSQGLTLGSEPVLPVITER